VWPPRRARPIASPREKLPRLRFDPDFPDYHIEEFTEGLQGLDTVAAPDRSLDQINGMLVSKRSSLVHLVTAEAAATDWQPFSHQCHDPLDRASRSRSRTRSGAMIATGLPRRVITTDSPLSAAFKIREKAWFASRAVTERIGADKCSVCTT
jgi:hypothetical protein